MHIAIMYEGLLLIRDKKNYMIIVCSRVHVCHLVRSG